MESDHPEPDVTETAATEAESSGATSEEVPTADTDPATLVDRLIEAGDNPHPDLLDQIAAAGEAALEPLFAFMRTYPQDDDGLGALFHGIGILGRIHSPASIPMLVEIIERYAEDFGEMAAQYLGDFGPAGFEPAMELIRDPQMVGYFRQNAINAALRAAAGDPTMRARLGEVLRPMLADAIERTREQFRATPSEPAEQDDDDEETEGWVLEDLDDEESSEVEEDSLDPDDVGEPSDAAGSEPSRTEPADGDRLKKLEPYEELMFLVGDLADLADPEARDLIKTAFAEDLVETF